MKPLRITRLALIAVIFAGFGWAAQTSLSRFGWPQIVPPWSLPVVLVLIIVIELALAWHVRSRVHRRVEERREHGEAHTEPVDPFFALRVLLLAKACAVTGAVLGGLLIGLLVFALLPPASPSTATVLPLAVTAGVSLLLAVAGWVAERWCRLPPDDPTSGSGSGTSGTDPSTAAARQTLRAREHHS
jgi:NADH:ubiquinone oxidoreductase subunit 5 (subunit L)/multisubunit Na+/H+ antiporter MnhA subunit